VVGLGVELVRRGGRGNEDHFFERELLERFTRENQMRVVDGIERPAIDADLPHDTHLAMPAPAWRAMNQSAGAQSRAES
jgi:hypothetical protein